MDADEQSDYQERRFRDAALPNLLTVGELLGLDVGDEMVNTVLTHLCLRLFYTGFEVGYSEAAAQAIEQGADVTLNVTRPLFDDVGPLSDSDSGLC